MTQAQVEEFLKVNQAGLCLQKEKFKLEDMVIGEAYPISSLEKKATRFGKQILVTLMNEKIVWLPKRMSDGIPDFLIDDMECSKIGLIYRGKLDTGKSNQANLFEFVKLFPEDGQ